MHMLMKYYKYPPFFSLLFNLLKMRAIGLSTYSFIRLAIKLADYMEGACSGLPSEKLAATEIEN